jgi:hypothetical protein
VKKQCRKNYQGIANDPRRMLSQRMTHGDFLNLPRLLSLARLSDWLQGGPGTAAGDLCAKCTSYVAEVKLRC